MSTALPHVRVSRILEDGRVIDVLPLLFGAGRLGIIPVGCTEFDDVWDYSSVDAAVVAAFDWDGQGEPEGWYRHPLSGRRRPNGDPALEFTRK